MWQKNINFLAGPTQEISGGGREANKSTGFTIINHNIDSLSLEPKKTEEYLKSIKF